MLNPCYLRALKYCEEEMIEDLLVTDILPDLRTHSLFTLEDEEIINHEITTKSKVVKLLEIIRNKDDECFEKFKSILEYSNEDIAENLAKEINSPGHSRQRRLSSSEVGELLIKGGVPERRADYIQRDVTENAIKDYLKSNEKKPLLIHGVIGCGKSTMVSHLLYTDELFPNRFLRCCWMQIGSITENDVTNKLLTIIKKLDPTVKIHQNTYPEVLMEIIREKLFDTTVLLILNDIYEDNIMHYFNFQAMYIVTSRIHLSKIQAGKVIEIPLEFKKEECTTLLRYYNIEESIIDKIIEKSHRNPKFLSMICKLLDSNRDYYNVIAEINVHTCMNDIMKNYIDMLDDDTRKRYETLIILNKEEVISTELLSIYWSVAAANALTIVNKLCDFNFLYKKWSEEYECNMYGIHSVHLEYLKHSKNENSLELQECRNVFIKNYTAKYTEKDTTSWQSVNHRDPFFFIMYGKTLYEMKDFETLIQIYTDFQFISANIVICGLEKLLNDYNDYRPPDKIKWNHFEKFLMRYSHKFNKLPVNNDTTIKIAKIFTMIIQLGLYEIKNYHTYAMAHKAMSLSKRNDFWEWTNPEPSIKIWEISHDEEISLWDVNRYAIVISDTKGRVRLFDLNSGKALFNDKMEESIILVKLINESELIIVTSNFQFRIFSYGHLLPKMSSMRLDETDSCDDDDDYRSQEAANTTSNDPSLFSIDEKFKQHTLKNNKLMESNVLQAMVFDKTIVFLQIIESGTYVAFYDMQARLNNDFKLEFPIKKYMYSENDFYALKEESGEIIVVDEFGCQLKSINIKNQVIVDFIVHEISAKEIEIICAAKNSIYKYTEKLFSVDSKTNIEKISLSCDTKLLALCLTNSKIQIWHYTNAEFMYSLNDSQFNDVYFTCNQMVLNSLITVGPTNIARWDLDILEFDKINKNNNAQHNSASHYHRHFTMHKMHSSSFVLVLQSLQNNLEFHLYEQGIPKIYTVQENAKASYFHCDGKKFFFIGFKIHGIKIYSMKNFEKIRDIMTVGEVKKLSTFCVSKEILGLVVSHSGNQITIFHLNNNTLEDVKASTTTDLKNDVSLLKFFQFNTTELTLAVVSYNCWSLYEINEQGCVMSKNRNSLKNQITDLDISNDNQHLCAISSHGKLKIWSLKNNETWNIDDDNESGEMRVLRKSKFRPQKSGYEWNVVAVITDKAVIELVYFQNNEKNVRINVIVEDNPSQAMQFPRVLEWSLDSDYLFVADYDIRKWKIPSKPRENKDVKLPLLKLQTYFGGIHKVCFNDQFICTIDQHGFLYILKKVG